MKHFILGLGLFTSLSICASGPLKEDLEQDQSAGESSTVDTTEKEILRQMFFPEESRRSPHSRQQGERLAHNQELREMFFRGINHFTQNELANLEKMDEESIQKSLKYLDRLAYDLEGLIHTLLKENKLDEKLRLELISLYFHTLGPIIPRIHAYFEKFNKIGKISNGMTFLSTAASFMLSFWEGAHSILLSLPYGTEEEKVIFDEFARLSGEFAGRGIPYSDAVKNKENNFRILSLWIRFGLNGIHGPVNQAQGERVQQRLKTIYLASPTRPEVRPLTKK